MQLNEATTSLDLKTSTISGLEARVDELQATLDSVTADLEASQQNLEGAELAKATVEKELAETKADLVASQGEGDQLGEVSDEVRHIFSDGSKLVSYLTRIAGDCEGDRCRTECCHRNPAGTDQGLADRSG